MNRTIETPGHVEATSTSGTSPPVKLCECGCGEPAPIATKNHSARGHVKGQPLRFIAHHRPLVVFPGERYGQLTVIAEYPERDRNRQRQFICQCDCGTETMVRSGNLRSGHTTTCGCAVRATAALGTAAFVAAQLARTSCLHGHDWTDEANVGTRPDGRRVCRPCSRAAVNRRRARKRGAYIGEVTVELLADEVGGWIYAECTWCCTTLTLSTATVEHVWPLGVDYVLMIDEQEADNFNGGSPIMIVGLHEMDNAVLACGSCNSSKNNRMLTEWWGR